MLPSFLAVKDNVVNDQAMLSTLSRYYRHLPLSVSDRQYCLDYARQQLSAAWSLHAVNKTLLGSIPKTLLRYRALCFLSLYCDNTIDTCFLGQGSNLIECIDEAVRHTLASQSSHSAMPRIAFCFLFNGRITTINSIRLGLDGIALQQKYTTVYFKNSVPIHHHFNLNTTLEKLSEKAGMEKNAYFSEEISLYRYDALEFTEDEKGILHDWYRGGSLLLNSDINQKTLREALTSATHFFEKIFLDTDEAIYYVLPSLRKNTVEYSLSALTRIIASFWQYNEVKKTEVIKKKLIGIVKKYFIYEKNFGYCAYENQTHLGINSLLLLAILSVEDDLFLSVEKKLLITWIEAQLSCDAKYFLLNNDEALLYAGQALLALMTLYEKTLEKKYLSIAESVFPYYQNLFFHTDNKTAMSLWFSKAYKKVSMVTRDQRYAKFVFDMNDCLLQYQIQPGYEEVDITGAFSLQGDSRITAVFIESLLCAFQLAENDEKRFRRYQNTVMLALRALLQMQVTQDQCSFLPAIGGFKNNIIDHAIRIDNVQHAIGAISNSLKCFFDE